MHKDSDISISNNIEKVCIADKLNLNSVKNREMMANMMVDFRVAAKEIKYNAIKQVLKKEFGNNYNFSDEFIAKVAGKLTDL